MSDAIRRVAQAIMQGRGANFPQTPMTPPSTVRATPPQLPPFGALPNMSPGLPQLADYMTKQQQQAAMASVAPQGSPQPAPAPQPPPAQPGPLAPLPQPTPIGPQGVPLAQAPPNPLSTNNAPADFAQKAQGFLDQNGVWHNLGAQLG